MKPISQITSLAQRIQIAPQSTQLDLFAGMASDNYLSRPVKVKVVQPDTGRILFKSRKQLILEPGGDTIAIDLIVNPGASVIINSELEMLLLDADDEEVLDRLKVTLKVEMDDWD